MLDQSFHRLDLPIAVFTPCDQITETALLQDFTHEVRSKLRRLDMFRQCLHHHSTGLLSRSRLSLARINRYASKSSNKGDQRQSSLYTRLKISLDRSLLSTVKFLRPYTPDWRQLGRSAVAIFLFWHVFTSYFYSFRACAGISMLPTLNSYGDWVLISKYYRRGRGIEVGDLVSYDHPVEEEVQGVKRVLGLEGDFVLRDSPGTSGKMIQVCLRSNEIFKIPLFVFYLQDIH